MADAEIMALLDHIKDVGERVEKKLDEHIERDESISKDFLLPLWNAHQQRQGAATMAAVLYGMLSGIIALVVTWFTGIKH